MQTPRKNNQDQEVLTVVPLWEMLFILENGLNTHCAGYEAK